VVIKNIKTWL